MKYGFPKYKLYHDNELIAESDGTPIQSMELKKGIKQWPVTLFGWGKFKRDKVTLKDILQWGSMRVCPPNRAGIEDILKLYNIEKYDEIELLRATQYRTIHDKFWMVVE